MTSMMGERLVRQDALFYEFSLEGHVPETHLLRSVDRFVELDGLLFVDGGMTALLGIFSRRSQSNLAVARSHQQSPDRGMKTSSRVPAERPPSAGEAAPPGRMATGARRRKRP